MKRLYWLSLVVFVALGAVSSSVAQPGAQQASGGTIERDLVGGAALIFRRPENPKTLAGGGRISGSRDRTPHLRTQDQILAKGNEARSAAAPRYSEAEGQYKLAAKQDPEDHRAFAGLGNIYLDQGRFSDAIDAYRDALRLKPDYQLVYLPLGFSLIRSNRYAEAIDTYNQLLKMDPKTEEFDKNEEANKMLTRHYRAPFVVPQIEEGKA